MVIIFSITFTHLSQIFIALNFMEEHLISSITGGKLCKVKPVEKDLYRITLDHSFIGYIRKSNGGWMMEENSKEELTAENVQLIGDQIDLLPWQLTQ